MVDSSEAPADPDFIKWIRWLAHHFVREGQAIRQAPLAFLIAVAAIGSIIFFGLEWHHSGERSTKDATIENQRSHISVLEEEVKGVQPQQAVINVKRRKIIEKLQQFYVEAGPLINSPVPKDAPVIVLDQYKARVDAWANTTITWIEQNMGEPAKERFLDNANGMSLMYTTAYNDQHNNYLNFLARSRRNLAALIENPAWDKFDPALH